MPQYIYSFGDKKNKRVSNSRNILGGKGANLAEMARLGLPVPPGFTISTKMCEIFYKNKKKLTPKTCGEIKKELKKIEIKTKKKFGDNKNPLLVSVRSGSRVSMPGMMDTILNLGLNDRTVEALSKKTSNERFAKDSYRRFIQMYGSVVLNIKSHHFEELIGFVSLFSPCTLLCGLFDWSRGRRFVYCGPLGSIPAKLLVSSRVD